MTIVGSPVVPATVKSAVSSGGLENVSIVFYNSIFSLIKKLKSLDYWTVGLEMDTEEDISNINLNNQKVALFIGSEERGLSLSLIHI